MWTLNDIHFPNGIALNKLGVVIGVREEHLGICLAGTARVRCLEVWEIRRESHDQLNKNEITHNCELVILKENILEEYHME